MRTPTYRDGFEAGWCAARMGRDAIAHGPLDYMLGYRDGAEAYARRQERG